MTPVGLPPALKLPPELRSCLASFCLPSDLASLARLHPSYRFEAERALYNSIAFRSNTPTLNCLRTLSTQVQKASFVHSLTIEFPRTWKKASRTAVTMLCDALSSMHAITDLRIGIPGGSHKPIRERLNQALRTKSSKLRTLYCPQFLDIEGIITDQPTLQHVGLYCAQGCIADTLERLSSRRESLSPMPLVFKMERDSFLPYMNNITIFPAFYHNPTAMCRTCAALFARDRVQGVCSTSETHVSQVSIFFRDLSDMALVCDVIKDMAISFPNVSSLVLHLERPRRDETIRQQHLPLFTKALSFISQLSELSCYGWDYSNDNVPELERSPRASRILKAQEWQAVCPNLWSITFLDGERVDRDYRDPFSAWG